MYKILLVEDDEKLCDKLAKHLIRWGYEVIKIKNFEKIMDEFIQINPHLVLMDINLPYFDGFYWCYKIREFSKCPILFLSSRDQDMDIIMAMNSGGDDYITKPFSVEVLSAKIAAILRRTYAYTDQQMQTMSIGNAVFNLGDHTLKMNDIKLELTKNESRILHTMLLNKDKIVSRDKIMRALWDDDQFVNDNTLTVNINRLRKKLEELGLKDCIKTKKGEGYMMQ
ncbi:response regulator transcription factor [Vallitalea okinawensis]|uniref:response regulator transcription factor n=1 Tax=Vallitalea okinawensis TaxID=2078660 RepID=UPI000CFCADD3|nr:response regulator transcription factor [Vallitalea okinawensis]